jgi:heat shock protein HslJ
MNQKTHWTVLLLALLLLAITSFANATEVNMTEFELTDTEWWVEDIDGKGVIDMSHTTLHFLKDGRVAGDTGCNRYNGSTEISGASISFDPMAGTRKACAPALMDQEMKFYQAVAKVVSWEVADTGLLHLKEANGNTKIRAWRVEE